MKYKPLALSFLLLLPLLAFAAPKTNAVNQVGLWISPKENKYWGPCKIDTTFTIDVNLFNKKEMTGFGVYAFDFNVTWDITQGISFVSAAVHNPWPAANSYIIVNEATMPGSYELAITAEGDATMELNDFQGSLVTITFRITKDPCWPSTYHTDLTLTNNGMSTQCTGKIEPVETDPGSFDLYSSQPNIELVCADANATDWINEKKNCPTHLVEVHLTNITHAYGFGFEFEYDGNYLETDIQKISIEPAFGSIFELLSIKLGPDTDGEPAGWWSLEVALIKPSEKPTVCSPDAYVINIPLHANATAQAGNLALGPLMPFKYDTSMFLDYGFVLAKGCGGNDPNREYDFNIGDESLPYTGFPVWEMISGCSVLHYEFKPNSADLNLDGHVKIEDVAAIAGVYGLSKHWGGLAVATDGLGDPSNVNIFDVVYVAKRWGQDC